MTQLKESGSSCMCAEQAGPLPVKALLLLQGYSYDELVVTQGLARVQRLLLVLVSHPRLRPSRTPPPAPAQTQPQTLQQ
jgi:hypothetical protein